jgi:hypothetical protein
MPYSEEQPILNQLREVIGQSGMAAEDLESDLHWEPGRLGNVLSGHQSLCIRDLFAVLRLIEMSAADFFGRVYGLDPRENGLLSLQHTTESRFEESQRVIEEALARRSAWKKERASF